MLTGDDSPGFKRIGAKIANVLRRAVIAVQVEHLVEVAVVELPVPADAERVAAHDAHGRGGVIGLDQPPHVIVIVARFDQVLEEAVDRQVCDGVELVEHQAVAALQLAFVIRLDRRLLGRQERADRVVDQIQFEPAPGIAVAGGVELADGFD